MSEQFNLRKEITLAGDAELEKQLRPLTFDDFRGQPRITENLNVFVTAALQRGEALDHVLLHGPPGLGKTTLATIISNELKVKLKVTSGPVLDKPGDLAGLLTSLEDGDVLFIDEIHRLSPVVEEYLYSAMEDYQIDIMIDKGPGCPLRSAEAESIYTHWGHHPFRPAEPALSEPGFRHKVPPGNIMILRY